MSNSLKQSSRELLDQLEKDIESAAALNDSRADTLEEVARRSHERWEGWQTQWQEAFKALKGRQRERLEGHLRTVDEMEATEAEFGIMEDALRECLETATMLLA